MKRSPRLALRVLRSLRGQLLLATAAPIVALLMLLSGVGVFGFTRMTQTLVEQRDAELVQLAAQQVSDYWGEAVLLLAQVAATSQMTANDPQAAQRLLAANAALQQRFDELAITDSQGVVVASVGGAVGDQVGGLSFFERARTLRRPVRSSPYQDVRGQRVIAVAVPIYTSFGSFAGCMLGVWRAQGTRLGLSVSGLTVGDRGYAYLVDEYGRILYHPDASLIGGDASQHPAVAALLRGETGAQTFRGERGTMVVGYAPIGVGRTAGSLFADESWRGWGLLTAELWDDIVAPLQPYVRLMLILLVLIVSLPLLILAGTTQRIAGPLQSLVEQVERVSSGQFDTQVSIRRGPSEVRDLELAFNRMVVTLRKYQRDIQNYVVSILSSQEQERKRVARELHDDTAQALVVLGRRIEMAQELLPPAEALSADQAASVAELRQELEALRDGVDDTLQGVRRFTRDLRPPLLEELGLARTLEILASRTTREERFDVKLSVEGAVVPLSPELELSLFRLVQEGISNVRRHSQATAVAVILRYTPDEVLLDIQDDGIGFDAPTDPSALMNSGRLGLMGIHERARLFGGRATIESAQGHGTRVLVTIPMSELTRPTQG